MKTLSELNNDLPILVLRLVKNGKEEIIKSESLLELKDILREKQPEIFEIYYNQITKDPYELYMWYDKTQTGYWFRESKKNPDLKLRQLDPESRIKYQDLPLNDKDKHFFLNEVNLFMKNNPLAPDNNIKEYKNMENVDEKAMSKKQQKFMGIVRSVQKGETDPSTVGSDAAKAAKTMNPKDVKDFAQTKHKGLPEKVKENYFINPNEDHPEEELKSWEYDINSYDEPIINLYTTHGGNAFVEYDSFEQLFDELKQSNENIGTITSAQTLKDAMSNIKKYPELYNKIFNLMYDKITYNKVNVHYPKPNDDFPDDERELDEITGGYIDNKIDNTKNPDKNIDPIGAAKRNRQIFDLATYVSPQIIAALKPIGATNIRKYKGFVLFDLKNSETAVTIKVTPTSHMFQYGDVDKIHPSLLPRISNAIKKVQKDLTMPQTTPQNEPESNIDECSLPQKKRKRYQVTEEQMKTINELKTIQESIKKINGKQLLF